MKFRFITFLFMVVLLLGCTQEKEVSYFVATEEAANLGDADEMVRLGGMYENGEGVPQDYIKAHMWYNLSSGFWDAGLDEERDGSGEERDALSDKMSREQIAEAQKMASNWLEEYKDSKANNN